MNNLTAFKKAISKKIYLVILLTLVVACDYAPESMNKNSNSDVNIANDRRRIINESVPISKTPFADQKVVINIKKLMDEDSDFKFNNYNLDVQVEYLATVNNLDGNIVLPANTQISVLVNNICLRQNSTWVSNLRSTINYSEQTNLTKQIYNTSLMAPTSLRQLEDDVRRDPCVMGVTEMHKYRKQAYYVDDPDFSDQDHLRSIQADEAYDFFNSVSLGNTEEVVLAVLDTGVDYTHPDLRNVMWVDANGNHGYDFINNDEDPMEDHYHGTHVAGLAAAETNNGVGVAGVAGANVKIMAVKVLGSSGGSSGSSTVNGIYYAIDNGADVINMSLGGNYQSAQLSEALSKAVEAGVTVVVAAGNDNREITASNFYSPAGYGTTYKGVITIGSVDSSDGDRSSFSNHSTTYVEMGAPGNEGSRGVLATYPRGDYRRLQGTSMATPVVAGAVALAISSLKSNQLEYTPEILETILLRSCERKPSLKSFFLNGNTLNLLGLANVLQQSIIEADGGF